MTRYLKLVAIVGVLGVVAVACGGGGGGGGATTTPPATGLQAGGTLKSAIISDVSAAFDPQKEYYSLTWQLYRCCLLRTLLNYNGRTTAEGGAEPLPDIASAMPEVSADGLTWTFHLKQGIKFGPPFQDTDVTAQDFIRALEREACGECSTGGYSFYYTVIKGFSDMQSGKADTISGLSAPDASTLEVTLTAPAGYTPFLFTMPATAPIPEGADTGHEEDYGRFLVSTGPYMFEGSENLDFSVPAKSQTPVAGYVPGKSIVMVRNPSYDGTTDDLRDAYLDGIDITIGGTQTDLLNKVEAGDLDLCLDCGVTPNLLKKYQTDPSLQQYLRLDPSDGVRYLAFNLAVPPFDDIHVRKAVSFAIDKDGLRRIRGGPSVGAIAGHIVVDSLENNLLADYDPYATPNSAGDVNAAKEEMKQSKYDTNGDGSCDESPECNDILTVISNSDPYPDQAALISDNLKPLGITLDIKAFEHTTMYNKCNDPSVHMALCTSTGWFKDFADAYTFMPPLFGSESLYPSCCNYQSTGADAAFLKKYGYTVTSVPSVDEQLAACNPKTGDERIQCYADLDKYLMEEVVPWVPYLFDNNLEIWNPRVLNWTYDQSSGGVALDHVALAGGGA